MEGPAGVSCQSESQRPPRQEAAPIRLAPIAMLSGVRAKPRAAAAGMISMAAISKRAHDLERHRHHQRQRQRQHQRSRLGLRPEACARSSLRVAVSSGCHRQTKSASTKTAPPQIKPKIRGAYRQNIAKEIGRKIRPDPAAHRKSPPDQRPGPHGPAPPKWYPSPSPAARVETVSAMLSATISVPAAIGRLVASASATPRIAACEVASPK